MTRLRERLADDSGSTMPLIIFFSFLCMVLIFLVVSATSLYLERKRLFTLADGAALVGAEAFALDQVQLTPDGARPELHDAEVAAAVRSYLATAPGARFDGLIVEQSGTLDGRSATVTLSSWWHPPVVSLLTPEGLRIEVTSVGRSVFH
ncbi:Tad domain-containing protein [Salinibacterium sp. G-O1]|uniref:Tad domain-containing protein n=1 Tax=Salinibacterium sp. G-O1 TaxID=3046208 RepID=UPI0024B97D7C|nr:Tad domain-containing protein [Salinibacterium sp. G-O1]MDJ0334579.1 Tad domain-containing protein [Salinibacterium sp. G-O1]